MSAVWVYILTIIALAKMGDCSRVWEFLDPYKGTLLAPLMTPRVPGTQLHAAARNHISQHFEKLGWDVLQEHFVAETPHGQVNMTNLVITRNGAQSALPKLTLAAHYDTLALPEGFIGAIDSAFPCALLMYVAQELQDYDIDAEFLFFDGEEAFVYWSPTDSIYGANYHAAHGRDLNTLVLLDLLGSHTGPVPSWFKETQNLHSELEQLNRELEKSKRVHAPRVGGSIDFASRSYSIEDDHTPFLRKGKKVLHLIPLGFPKQWHTIEDDADHLDRNTIEDWATLMVEWLKRKHLLTREL